MRRRLARLQGEEYLVYDGHELRGFRYGHRQRVTARRTASHSISTQEHQNHMKHSVTRFLFAASALLLSACSLTAPKYTFSPDQVQVLRAAALAPAKVGAVSAQGPDAHNDSITLRGTGMHSPYGSYAQYLQEALTQDLREARLLDAQS